MVSLDKSYLDHCWLQDDSRIRSDLALSLRDINTQQLVPEIIGFTIYTIVFGDLAYHLNFLLQLLISHSSIFSNQLTLSVLSFQE
jgi:hypothetical protein